jgi:hypothetical protein
MDLWWNRAEHTHTHTPNQKDNQIKRKTNQEKSVRGVVTSKNNLKIWSQDSNQYTRYENRISFWCEWRCKFMTRFSNKHRAYLICQKWKNL